MAAGATKLLLQRLAAGRLHGVIGLGGLQGTATGTMVMRALPYGLPKVMVSTVASGDTSPYVGISDITMMFSVGDILGRHFGAGGEPIDSPLAGRVIALPLETLRQIPQVIAFAGGLRKAGAILGALRGRYIHVLITDEATAKRLLESR